VNLRHNAPSVVHFEINWNCNQNCVFCYNYWRDFADFPANPSLGFIKRVINRLNSKDVTELVISGGEPTLRRDLAEILHYASPLFPYVRLNTNGTCISDQLADAIRNDSVDVLVSLHAASRSMYSKIVNRDHFNIVISNMRKLLRRGIDFTAMFVATRRNLSELELVGKLLDKMGVKRLSVARVCYFKRCSPRFEELELHRNDVLTLNDICKKIINETKHESILSYFCNSRNIFTRFKSMPPRIFDWLIRHALRYDRHEAVTAGTLGKLSKIEFLENHDCLFSIDTF